MEIGASDRLMSMLRGTIKLLEARASLLGVSRRQKSQSLANFQGSDIASFFLLQTIRTHLPELTHIADRQVHPEQLFVTMLRLAGGLSAFSVDLTAHRLPVYDHQELGSCMSALDREIHLLLETVIPSRFISIPFRSIGENTWACEIPQDWVSRDVRFVIGVRAQIQVGELIQKFTNLTVVSTPDFLDRIIAHRISGLTLRHMTVLPPSIPMRLDSQYFELIQSGANWEAIRKHLKIAIRVPDEIPNPQLELLLTQ
jgi:type VI secretion system protein ImpJ